MVFLKEFFNKKNEWLILLLIIISSFLIRILYLYASNGFSRPPIEDSADYHLHALNLLKEGSFFVLNEHGEKVYSSRPPMLPILLSLFYLFL